MFGKESKDNRSQYSSPGLSRGELTAARKKYELSKKISKAHSEIDDFDQYERMVMLEKLRNANTVKEKSSPSPEQRKYNPNMRYIKAIKDQINSITVMDANEEDVPLKSAIP